MMDNQADKKMHGETEALFMWGSMRAVYCLQKL